MERDQQDYHAMVRTVVLTFTQHEAAAATPPMMATLRGTLTAREASLAAERRRQGDAITSIGENKSLLQREMIQWTLAATGIGLSHARFTGNADLARDLDVYRTDLLTLPDLDCRDRCQSLLDLVTAEPLRATLLPYGLTEDLLETADDLVDEFSALIGKPRQLAVARRVTTGRIAALIADLRTFLDGVLDPFMRQYGLPIATPEGLARQALHAAYTAARIIVNHRGGGGAGEEEDEESSSASGEGGE